MFIKGTEHIEELDSQQGKIQFIQHLASLDGQEIACYYGNI